MSDNTGIEWTDATWNPITGCTKVSAGCDNCYAETLAERFRGTPGHYYERGFDVQLRPEKLDQPLRWRKPRRIFVNSMSDLFHDSVPDEYIAQVFEVMALAPQHTFQVLTKRHARMRGLVSRGLLDMIDDPDGDVRVKVPRWPLPNVWLGVSAEDQQWADIRIPALLDTPAVVRFVSAEPLLGPIDLSRWIDQHGAERAYPHHITTCGGGQGGCFHPPCRCDCHHLRTDRLHWVICGGESGRRARPMHPDWARGLRDQCQAAGVAFLFKQWGEYAPRCSLALNDTPCACNGQSRSHPINSQRVGKKAAGRELDGRTWDEYPAVRS